MAPHIAFSVVILSAGASAFTHNVMAPPRTCRHLKPKILADVHQLASASDFRQTSTALEMYNLPPSGGGGGGGGGGPGNDIQAILPGILTVAGLTLFFISPLGGIFFAVTNTLFALAIVTPVLGWVGLQIWQAFNTVSGPCPNCGFPVRTLKDDEGQPSICVSCGSLIRTNAAKDGIELCNNPNDIMGGGSVFDQLFGSMAGISPQQVVDEIDADVNGSKPRNKSPGESKSRRENTIIDVDVESD
uniref:TFIIB-type domain-containing protein n=1 Tax=Minutocellus polymorphus TaxID=265543 RepID=A0A7S0ACI9_9STRA|mmetsp:Transcript_10756/g.17885  ORF Transcript_10756/g.17885 Transcript_10756/m.17885 type:complete len:245 (+) Transcript_10756:108-842(+)